MTLKTTIDNRGTELEVDLDELRRYGQYFIDDEQDLIIRATVYTHGTDDSRFVAHTEVGTDYVFRPVTVDTDEIKQSLETNLDITITDEVAQDIRAYYQQESIEVAGSWAEDFHGYRILRKTQGTILSTDVDESLLGWEQEFKDLIDRAEATTTLTRREITQQLLDAARNASPGEHEYSVQVELTDTH